LTFLYRADLRESVPKKLTLCLGGESQVGQNWPADKSVRPHTTDIMIEQA